MRINLHSCCGDEDACVDDTWLGTGDTHDEADQDDHLEWDDKHATLADAIGHVCGEDAEDGREDIDGHGKELGICGRIAQISDDRWQEKCNAIEWCHDTWFLISTI